jgi:hypothetical protein
VAREILSVFEPLPPQRQFLLSDAKIRGYGGALGGGKSRTGCEAIFDACLDYPGIKCLVAREAHTSIVETTKKTMLEQVIPNELIAHRKASQGEDYVELFNGSTIHFIGLDNPYRWYSSEIGYVFFDEAQEMDQDKVTRIITRLRQPCGDCVASPRYVVNEAGKRVPEPCDHLPHRAILCFNPAEPGHWLQQWFIIGGSPTDSNGGFRKEELFLGEATSSFGSCEFVKALAKDNPYLPPGYVEQTLEGLPPHLRRRYLEGIWEFITGTCFFDEEALLRYQAEVIQLSPVMVGHTAGDLAGDTNDRVRLRPAKSGPWVVWETPVRAALHSDKRPARGCTCPKRGTAHDHRYLLTVDVSSGGSTDYSGIQVIDIEEYAQVAEFQGKLPPHDLAVEVFRAALIWNDGLVVPEITGGWGASIVAELERLMRETKRRCRIYTRRVEDRIAKRFTDKLGWDTNKRTRSVMLDTLERVLREGEFKLRSERSVLECLNFVRDDAGKPAARPGTNDDLVVTLAMGVTLCDQMPRQMRKVIDRPHVPAFSSTGY